MFAPVAESVDALDLKSNWAYNPVPVQVWPGAFLKDLLITGLFYYLTWKSYFSLLYSSSVTDSSHSLEVSSPSTSTARCENQL